MTNQEKLDAFQARITKFINSNSTNDRLAWSRSGIAKVYMILCDDLTGDDLDSLHSIALAAVPQLNAEFGARLTAINER
jgi:hypothetical protein